MDQVLLNYLMCPKSQQALKIEHQSLISNTGEFQYPIDQEGIPLFAEKLCSAEAKTQQLHYDKIAETYTENLNYPHTKVYSSYLDKEFIKAVDIDKLGVTIEICCGTGEALGLLKDEISMGIGLDISLQMLHKAKNKFNRQVFHFIQADATTIPIRESSIDSVLILGGIHHVPNRDALFSEISRILKPGGQFIWREPVSDFWLWKFLRKIIYRLSPILDHNTESPLLYNDTVPVLEQNNFVVTKWQTFGFFGFCLFMNSDVLFFNRFFRFIPGIKKLTHLSAQFDNWITHRKWFKHSGLQVVGRAVKC
jgi:ubiquinone/menaquinone biosynthesis C-methylase UbiE